MAVGESANFISYGLAAASVVAPLGTVGQSASRAKGPVRLSADLLAQIFNSSHRKLFHLTSDAQ